MSDQGRKGPKDAGVAPAQNDTYWLAAIDRGERVYQLFVDGRLCATVFVEPNIAIIANASAPDTNITLPHSQVMLDEVERRVGLGRVPFRAAPGGGDSDHRAMAEQAARVFRAAHPGADAVRHYVGEALRHLNRRAEGNEPLPLNARQARWLLVQALEACKQAPGAWSEDARQNVEAARSEFAKGSSSVDEAFAADCCEKAALSFGPGLDAGPREGWRANPRGRGRRL